MEGYLSSIWNSDEGLLLLYLILYRSNSGSYSYISEKLYSRIRMSRLSLNPDKDLPNLSGKVVLITGGTKPLVLYSYSADKMIRHCRIREGDSHASGQTWSKSNLH